MKNSLLHINVTNTAARYPNNIAIRCGKNSLTYLELEKLINILAAALRKAGVNRGDRIVIQLGNSIEAILAFWATLKVGAIASIIGEDIVNEKLAYIVKDSGATFFFTKRVNSKLLEALQLNESALTQIVALAIEQEHKSISILKFDDLLNNAPVDVEINSKALSIDLASIIYTSGSTGEPKGVMLTHHNMLAATSSINAYLHYKSDDTVLSALPIAFDYGLYQIILCFSVGATLILESDFTWPLLFCRKAVEVKATIIPVVPSMVTLLHDVIQQKAQDFSSVRMVTNTGAALTTKHIMMTKNIFPAAEIYSMYGLTECKRCTYLPPKDLARKPDSIGIAIPDTELWLVNDDDQRVGPGEIGQLVIRGATVMKGYWNKPVETAKKLKPGLLPGEQVLYTGDYAVLDREGYLYFKGRMDEIIKSRGIKVSPKEIEEVISQFNGVKETAVVGVDDIDYGTAIYAFISPVIEKSIDTAALHIFCSENLSKEQCPIKFLVMDNLPKTENGKLNKRMLQAHASALVGAGEAC